MRLRNSGMPDESYWESLFDVLLILSELGIDERLGDVVELGCGYGTFSVPVANAIHGTLYTYDIEPEMVARTIERATKLPRGKLVGKVRDVMEQGFGVTGSDAVLLFNILHCDEPVRLLRIAADGVKIGGFVLVIHWRYGETPRGPDLSIRPRPEQIVHWGKEAGLFPMGTVIDLPPWHYGLRLCR